MMKKILFLCFMLFSFNTSADVLTTENYIITIKINCGEGNVSCNDVTYNGVSKKSGNTINLKGEIWHGMCADGVTPCRFLGYKFKNGNTYYLVHESGLLQVIEGEKIVLLEENGEWEY